MPGKYAGSAWTKLWYDHIIGGATDEQKDRDGYAEDLAIAASCYSKSAEYVRSTIDYYEAKLLLES